MTFSPEIALLLAGVGLIAGIAAGFIGIGGGVVMVPVLLELLRAWGVPADSLVQAAMGTSLAVATFSVASSAWRHHRQGQVVWSLVPYIVPGSIVGGWLAAQLAVRIDGRWLQIGLALVLLYAAVKMLRDRERPDRLLRQARWYVWSLVGFGLRRPRTDAKARRYLECRGDVHLARRSHRLPDGATSHTSGAWIRRLRVPTRSALPRGDRHTRSPTRRLAQQTNRHDGLPTRVRCVTPDRSGEAVADVVITAGTMTKNNKAAASVIFSRARPEGCWRRSGRTPRGVFAIPGNGSGGKPTPGRLA